MRGSQCERGSPAARVADEMEPVEAVGVSLSEDTLDLGVEAVVRGRLLPRVHLEILRDGVDTPAERLEQRPIC